MSVAVVTDSNSGITQAEARELGIDVIPMPFIIDGEPYLEDINLTQEQFYEKLRDKSVNVSTTQPSPEDVAEVWLKDLETHEAVIHIPMSSGLSNTCETLTNFVANDERFKGKVFVVDNQRISVTQRQSTYDAIKMAAEGKSAQEIYDWLMATKMTSSIYIMVDTLYYLKKGGRLTPAVAMIGTILKLKPVLQIQGYKLDTYNKSVRKLVDAKKVMIKAVHDDFDKRFAKEREAGKMVLAIAHTDNYAEADKFKGELEAEFPDVPVVFVDPLSLSVSCHIGPGALAVTMAISY
ncbi:MAG: DegV family protein [Clostridia bacterium]|nr:DegV family protein [Clostridia bacterium]